jgi:hypothetical protein
MTRPKQPSASLYGNAPADLWRRTVAELYDLASGKPVAETTAAEKGNENNTTILPLCENDLYFLATFA